ncbi:MAG TPA: hypothetical protein VF789_05170 [Thermoanaerobaculia bacterium]
MSRNARNSFLTLVSLITMLLVTTVPARAVDLASCTGVATVTASPPITSTPQAVTFTMTVNYPLCVMASFPFVRSAQTVQVQYVPAPLSCEDLAGVLDGLGELSSYGQGPVELTIDWSSGADSIFEATGSVTASDDLVRVNTITGSISSGLLAGASARRENIFAVYDLDGTTNGSLETPGTLDADDHTSGLTGGS